MSDLKIGSEASLTSVVTRERTAARLATEEGEKYPEVLSTPNLIGDLERACAMLLEPLQQEGQLSVTR